MQEVLRMLLKDVKFLIFFRNIADLLIIQETHSQVKDYKLWRNEWGGEIHLCHGETNARGIGIFVKRNCPVKISNCVVDEEGRIITCDVEENDEKVSVIAIYAPNKDSPQFFRKIAKILKERCEKRIIIGDFNLVLDVDKDRLNTYQNNEKAKERSLKYYGRV